MKFLYTAMSARPESEDTNAADRYAGKARFAYAEIQRLTAVYNTEVAGGKWNGIMDWKPRNRPVFQMPSVSRSSKSRKKVREDSPLIVIDATRYCRISEIGQTLCA